MHTSRLHGLYLTRSALYFYSGPTPRLHLSAPQNRSFFPNPNDLLSSLSGTLAAPSLRHLAHTAELNASPALVFRAIASVDQYPQFLPFILSARVTERDTVNWPTKATLRVGYDKLGLEEHWESIVRCDEAQGVVEARGNKSVQKAAGQGLFDVLRTRWQIGQKREETVVRLDIEVQLRNMLYDKMFEQVENKVARTMVNAFEKRVDELKKISPG